MAFDSVWLGGRGQNLVEAYLNSPWSAYCRLMRGNNADFSLVNYATFWFRVPNGIGGQNLFHWTASSGQYHSEKHVWQAIRGFGSLDRMSIPNWRTGESVLPLGVGRLNADGVFNLDGTYILGVYTERQPCGTCSPSLNDVLRDGTPVGWHFPYPSKETKKHKHSDDDIGANALMALQSGKSYEQNLKDNQRTYRVEGNDGLKESMSYISHGHAHQAPVLAH